MACGSDGDAPPAHTDPGEPYLGLATPANGFQLRSVGAEIGPGEEREYCEVVRMPGAPSDEYYVSSMELGNGTPSHHFGLAVALPGTKAVAELEALGAGNRIECTGPQLAFGDGIDVIATIQTPYGQTSLPPGVARKHFGGDLVVFDYHYVNPGHEAIQARSAANFHLVDSATVQHVAQEFGLNDVTIDIPAGQTGSVSGECHFGSDVMVGAFTRHTHHWGTDFSVWYSGGANDGAEIWTSHDWLHETEFAFPEPVLLRAGEGFRYRCTYANDTARRLRFGTRVNDEMCMLYGPTWAAHDGQKLDPLFCNVTWIDDQGIGHPATEAGGFPKPSAFETSVCTSAVGASINACNSCICDSCATPGLKCAADADCSPLLGCLVSCTDLACINSCQALAREHSSGAGLFMAATECAMVECPMCFP